MMIDFEKHYLYKPLFCGNVDYLRFSALQTSEVRDGNYLDIFNLWLQKRPKKYGIIIIKNKKYTN